jgi:antitoxin (DNA-binding transcriptional repressor) of toxin-antitoxin stability system
MHTPTITKPITRRVGGLTDKGRVVAVLVTLREQWDTLSPSQQAEAANLVERLAAVYRREHSVSARTTTAVRVPLLGRLTA